MPGDRPPTENRDEEHELAHEDQAVEVKRGHPGDVGTLDHEGADRIRVETEAAARGGVSTLLASSATPAYFRRRDHRHAVLLVGLAENRRPDDRVLHLVEDAHLQTSLCSQPLQSCDLLRVGSAARAWHFQDEWQLREAGFVEQGTKTVLPDLSGADVGLAVPVGAEAGDRVVAVDHLDALHPD